MIMRLVETFSVVGLAGAAGSLLAQTSAPPGFMEYGALGLCSLMVWQNYRQSAKLGSIIDQQQERLTTLHVETLEAMDRMTRGMNTRPCLRDLSNPMMQDKEKLP